jgi:hypothetical protein
VRALTDVLRSFVRWQTNAEILTLQSDFDWSYELAPVKKRFTGYTWAKPLNPERLAVYGICPLTCRWPNDLVELEAAIYAPHGDESPRPVSSNDLDHYITIELLTPNTAHVNLAMLAQHRDWYLLDSHMLTIP